jgi:hypothetical protein
MYLELEAETYAAALADDAAAAAACLAADAGAVHAVDEQTEFVVASTLEAVVVAFGAVEVLELDWDPWLWVERMNGRERWADLVCTSVYLNCLVL